MYIKVDSNMDHYNAVQFSVVSSDVNKDLTLKAKAKAKDSTFKAKAKNRTFEGLNRELDI